MNAARGFSLLQLFLLCSFFLMSFTLVTHAQLDMPNMDNSVFITTVPDHPRPGDVVQLYVQSVYFDLPHMNNVWTVNGKVVAQGIGVVQASFTAGALGSNNAVVFKADSDTNSATARINIIPTEVDLLYESDSYVPPFYRGRALPSEGTSVRLLALPRFQNSANSFIPASSLTYTWKRNGSVVNTVSGKGMNAVLLPSPVLFGTDSIEVDVTTSDGTMSGSASMNIPSVKPLLLLYEDHPLFGVTYHKSLGPTTFVSESEMSFVAVPYFANATSPNDKSLSYDWTVNNQHINADDVKKNAITISAAGQKTGLAQISLDMAQPQNPFFSAHGDWTISFSSVQNAQNPSAPVNNPFLPQQ
jgi:hypothetical protein